MKLVEKTIDPRYNFEPYRSTQKGVSKSIFSKVFVYMASTSFIPYRVMKTLDDVLYGFTD